MTTDLIMRVNVRTTTTTKIPGTRTILRRHLIFTFKGDDKDHNIGPILKILCYLIQETHLLSAVEAGD